MNRIYHILSSILGDSKQGGFDKNCMQYQFNCRSCEEEKGVNENKYNLEVNLEMGKCHCWACDFKGPISRIIKKWGTKEQLQDYYNIIQDLKNSRYNEIGLFKDTKDANNGYHEDFLRLPQTFTKIDLNKLRKRKLSEYLAKRKINQEIIDFYNLGYTTWDEKNSFVRISEMLPEKIFKTITNCECKATDISSGITNANTIIATARAFPSTVSTNEWNFYPLEYVRSIEGYVLPTKLHIVWTVRGIANS